MSKGYLDESPTIEPFDKEEVAGRSTEQAAGVPPGTAPGMVQTEPVPSMIGRDLPPTTELRSAFERVSYIERLKKSIMSTTNTLIVVAAVAILVAMLFLPVLRIYGQSMNATLWSGDLVFSLKGSSF